MQWILLKSSNRKKASMLAKKIVSKYYGFWFGDTKWDITEYGKPYFRTKDIEISCFNYAHSGNYLLIGLSFNEFIGVDIEDISKKRKNIDKILTVFSDEENRYVNAFSKEERKNAILDIWVKKEAIGKALGVGLLYDTSQITVCEQPGKSSIVANTVVVNNKTIIYSSKKIEQCCIGVAYVKEGNGIR